LRIRTSEMLATPDAEKVLRVLEQSLRDISAEVVRDGQRITMRGLGPSHRTMNRNDIAVVEVECENYHTVIRADITYQASALLSGVPQDDLVRSKLDRVLDRVKAELRTESVRVETVSWFADPAREPDFEPEYIIEPEYVIAQKSVVEVEHGEAEPFVEPVRAVGPIVEPEPDFKPENMIEPECVIDQESMVEVEHGLEPGTGGEAEPLVEPVRAVEPIVAPEPVHAPEPEIVVARGVSAALPVATENGSVGAAVEKRIVVEGSSSPEKWAEVPMFRTFHAGDTKAPKRWGLLATVACMLAAVGLFLAWPYLVGLVHERLNPSSSVAEEGASGEISEATKLADDEVPIQAPDANTVAAQNGSTLSGNHTESDPKVWLESWADAMRGQDANAQASFYADPVERYALKSNVSNADVWLDKQNAIQGRPKDWTVKLEDVVVEPRPDESLRVRLTKHYTSAQTEGGAVSERFVHSQLKLRKIDGQWKITSEQNLRQ
jgi:ketosteroid isomerase-like protein